MGKFYTSTVQVASSQRLPYEVQENEELIFIVPE